MQTGYNWQQETLGRTIRQKVRSRSQVALARSAGALQRERSEDKVESSRSTFDLGIAAAEPRRRLTLEQVQKLLPKFQKFAPRVRM